jgi:hypothetical protein
VETLPWLTEPADLYGRSVRIEVFGIIPARTRVVDSVVYFGDGAPERPYPGMPDPDTGADGYISDDNSRCGGGFLLLLLFFLFFSSCKKKK